LVPVLGPGIRAQNPVPPKAPEQAARIRTPSRRRLTSRKNPGRDPVRGKGMLASPRQSRITRTALLAVIASSTAAGDPTDTDVPLRSTRSAVSGSWGARMSAEPTRTRSATSGGEGARTAAGLTCTMHGASNKQPRNLTATAGSRRKQDVPIRSTRSAVSGSWGARMAAAPTMTRSATSGGEGARTAAGLTCIMHGTSNKQWRSLTVTAGSRREPCLAIARPRTYDRDRSTAKTLGMTARLKQN